MYARLLEGRLRVRSTANRREILLQLMQVRQSLTQLLREITEAPAHILLQDLRPRGVILLQKRDHRRDICTLSAWLIKKARRCGAV